MIHREMTRTSRGSDVGDRLAFPVRGSAGASWLVRLSRSYAAPPILTMLAQDASQIRQPTPIAFFDLLRLIPSQRTPLVLSFRYMHNPASAVCGTTFSTLDKW